MEIINTESEVLKRTVTTAKYNDRIYRYFELSTNDGEIVDSYIRNESGENIDNPLIYELIQNSFFKQREKEEEFYALKNEIIDCHKECEYIIYGDKIHDRRDVVIEKDDILIYSVVALHKGVVKATLSMRNMVFHERDTDSVIFMHKISKEIITFQF